MTERIPAIRPCCRRVDDLASVKVESSSTMNVEKFVDAGCPDWTHR